MTQYRRVGYTHDRPAPLSSRCGSYCPARRRHAARVVYRHDASKEPVGHGCWVLERVAGRCSGRRRSELAAAIALHGALAREARRCLSNAHRLLPE